MIILKGNNEHFLSVSLHDILSQIENINTYIWKLIWIEGVSRQINILELEEMVNKSADGLLIDSKDLLNMSILFDDLMEVVLLGDKDEGNLHKLENDDDIKVKCEYFIELIDSSYWEITSQNESFIKNIKKNFTFEESQ